MIWPHVVGHIIKLETNKQTVTKTDDGKQDLVWR